MIPYDINSLAYIFLVVLSIYILFVLYFRIKYPFWSIQPVFHFHNLKHWLFPCGVLYKDGKFKKSRYYDPYNITVKPMNDCDKSIIEDFYSLVQTNYMDTKTGCVYYPPNKKIQAYFIGHNNPCFLSYTYSMETLQDYKNKLQIQRKKMISALTSRPLHIYIDGGDRSENGEKQLNSKGKYLLVNYVDYLCTHKQHRSKGYAPKVIYTYAIDSQAYSPNTNIFFFKREGESTAIVPCVTYMSYIYKLKLWNINTHIDKTILSVVRIKKDNYQLIRKCLNPHYLKQVFPFVVCCDVPNIIELLEHECIYIYALLHDTQIHAVYIFRNSDVKYDSECVIDCIGSILYNDDGKINVGYAREKNDLHREQLFFDGFLECVKQIREFSDMKYLVIENISYNNILLREISKKYIEVDTSPTSYYLYNYIMRPYMEYDTFLLL